MIYPSLALFLGTGNATPDLPTIMMERLYTSPTYGMWYPADSVGLSTNLPPMVVFPEETAFYTKWKEDLERKGVTVRLNTEVNAIVERSKSKGVVVQLRGRRETEDKHNPNGADQDMPIVTEHYDELILCVLADTAKRLLGKTATGIESKVLGVPTWSDDITVTHTDVEYMEKHFQLHMPDSVPQSLSGQDQSERIAQGKKDFAPMYLIRQVDSDPAKLEMCFDCSAFQYQLKQENRPLGDHVFQTIFLNKKDEKTWSRNAIRKDKISA